MGANDVDNCGEIDRLNPTETMHRIYANSSHFQNLTNENYAISGIIFNETGKSVGYIRMNDSYVYEMTIEMQNGTTKNIGPSGSLEDFYKEADSLKGPLIIHLFANNQGRVLHYNY